MKKERISIAPLETVVFLGLLTLATDRLPTALSGCGAMAWLCILLGGVVLLALFWWIRPQFGKEKKEGRFLALLLLLWGLFWTGVQAGSVGHRVAQSLRGSPVLLTAVLLVLVGWMVSGSLPALTRACSVFVMAVGFGFALIVLFGVFRLDYPRVIAFQAADLPQVPIGVLSVMGVLAVGCYALVLRDEVHPPSEGDKHGFLQLGGLILLLAVAVILVIGRFGVTLMGQLDRPFFQMVSGLGLEGGFQRLEAVVSALWLLGDVALLTLVFLSLRHLTATVFGKTEGSSMGWWLVGISFLAGLPVTAFSVDLRGLFVPIGNLIAGGLLVWGYGRSGEPS